MKSRKIGGVRVDFDISYGDVLTAVDRLIAASGSHYLWTVNPEFVIDAQKDSDFKRLLNESAVSIADGAGLLFARKYLDWAQKLKNGDFFPATHFFFWVVGKGTDGGEICQQAAE